MRSLATARTGGVVVISPAAGNRPGSGAGEGAFRRFPNHPLLLLTVLASLLLTLPATAAPSKPGELVVKTRKGTSVRNLAGGLVVSQAPAPGPGGTRVLSLAAGVSPEDAAARLRDRPGVVFAEPNYVIRKARVPDDPRYPEQWDLAGMGAATAWDYSTGANVVIAVVDTGIDYHHEDLAANLWTNPGEVPGDGKDNDGDGIVDDVYGARFKDGTVTGDPMDDDNWDSHGTSVAGIAAGVTDNGKGISGTGWGAPVMAVKVLHGGQGVGSVADAAAGIRYAVDHGAQVINLSFTVPARSLTLEDALSYADRHGALVVSAAGNSGADLDTNDVSPGGLPNPNNVTVAAALEDGTLAGYSNFGATAVDLAAPGGRASYDPSGILSTMATAAGHGKYI
ncbi:MAG TPA: S8 family serine peptidase, partial [Gammaproteobacteria bacterium]|nr:S8 family serine peptidase [Gammaproteobacteria bacterium]